MASYLLTHLSWKRKRARSCCMVLIGRYRCEAVCSTSRRHYQHTARCRSYPSGQRKYQKMINMATRLRLLSVLVAWLSILTTASALPPPSTLHDKLLRDEAKRRRAKATPTPIPAPAQNYSAVPATQPVAAQSRVAARPVAVQTKTTQPAAPPSARSSTIVVIDAGHGGFDRGGIPGQRVAEKTMNLDVAQRLRAILSANGYRTIMTRDSDVFVPLGTRVAIANSYRNAIFVCIHFNAARRGSASGIETYFYSSQSLPLASAIHYYVAGGAPSSNRGVRRRGFYVLRK